MEHRSSLTPQQSTTRTEEQGHGSTRYTAAKDAISQALSIPDPPREWTAKSVRQTLASMNGNGARGVDCWTLGEMLRLPDGDTLPNPELQSNPNASSERPIIAKQPRRDSIQRFLFCSDSSLSLLS